MKRQVQEGVCKVLDGKARSDTVKCFKRWSRRRGKEEREGRGDTERE